MGPDTYVHGVKIPSGAYVVYPFSDVHLDPQLYPDPWRFDPGRPEQKMPFAYVGWGGGEYHDVFFVRALFLVEEANGAAMQGKQCAWANALRSYN